MFRAGTVVRCECEVKDTTPFLHEIARQLHDGEVSNKISINGESCRCSTKSGQKDEIIIKNIQK